MLGKLLKYEARAGARLLPIVYLALVGVSLIGLLARTLRIEQVKLSAGVLMIAGAVSAVVLTLVLVILRFYKGLFGAEGYLTQTLPVGKGALILSKMIAAYVWMTVSLAVAAGAVLGALYILDVDLGALWVLLFSDYANATGPLLAYFLVGGAVQLFAFIGELYFAVTLANTRPFIRNNAVFSVVFFFVANMMMSVLELVAILVIPLGLVIGETGAHWTAETMMGAIPGLLTGGSAENAMVGIPLGVGSFLVDILAGAALLVAAWWLLTHKTSVK